MTLLHPTLLFWTLGPVIMEGKPWVEGMSTAVGDVGPLVGLGLGVTLDMAALMAVIRYCSLGWLGPSPLLDRAFLSCQKQFV